MNREKAPFKFLDSYRKEDRDIFFGRENETAELYNALSGVKHLLVHGPPGAGKTSLIECGLRNLFSDLDWFALTIRRGDGMTASVFSRINESLRNKITLNPHSGLPLNADQDFGQAIERLFAERYQPVYLLFDQFEELLISGDDEEKKDFFTRLNQLIRYKVPCRVLLIMREEFMGHLSEFEPLCPSIFLYRFRLDKMRKENVKAVIRQTLDAPYYRHYFKVENSGQLTDSILARLPDQSREIELAHVQVFLSELWDRAAATAPPGQVTLHAGLIREEDNLAGVLNSFLNKQLGELAPLYGDKPPLEVLAAMISERHTKLQVSEKNLLHDLRVKAVRLIRPLQDLLHDLVERRIIRALKAGEQMLYEISHDVLALVVGDNLTDEMQLREKASHIYRVYEERKGNFSQEDLDYIRPYRQYRAYPPALKRKIRESEEHLRAEALRLQREKDEQLAEAVRRMETEMQLREQAERARNNAEEQRTLAEAAKNEAEKQRTIAEKNATQARKNQKRAQGLTSVVLMLALVAVYMINLNYLQQEETKKKAAELNDYKFISSTSLEGNIQACEKLIKELDYEGAYSRLKTLVPLVKKDTSHIKRKSIHDLLFELAFWYTESDQYKLAIEVLDSLNSLRGLDLPALKNEIPQREIYERYNSSRITSALKNEIPQREALHSLLCNIDSKQADLLEKRYYPNMIRIPDSVYTFTSNGKNITFPINGLYMAETETTWWQYNLYCVSKKIKRPDQTKGINITKPDSGDYPVAGVSWSDAVAYTNWLNERRKAFPASRPPLPVSGPDGPYRLPYGFEWEYAAKADTNLEYSGSNVASEVAWFEQEKPNPVKKKNPNRWGLYDMSGNLWEWCGDGPGRMPVTAFPELKEINSELGDRVRRGGSWYEKEKGNRNSIQETVDALNPNRKLVNLGFRVARRSK